jgi:L,D-transpeptidase-like protein
MRFVRSSLLAAIVICLHSVVTPSHARSTFWPEFRWGDRQYTYRHRHEPTKSDLAKKARFQDVSKGQLDIIISIENQRVSLYENGALIAHSSVSTGVKGHPTPLGVFSVLSKEKWHRSNIYSNAPMPYMQRITWSGIALHAGDLPGYPASHGCIRLTHDFAIRLWHLTKRGTRVIIARNDVRPVEVNNPRLFLTRPEVASGAVETGTAEVAGNDIVAVATPEKSRAEAQDPVQMPVSSSAAKPQKAVPISIFVSRKLSKLFVRRGFTPLFDVPVKIQNPEEPIGTHVFDAMEFPNQGTTIRWTVVTIPEKSDLRTSRESHKEFTKRAIETVSSTPEKANAALNRIEIPQDAVERISKSLTSGASLIISDYGISDETGVDTDFIVLTR